MGSIQKHDQRMWVWDEDSKRILFKPISYMPGLYKIFDEILVNAADNKQRDPKGMTALKVEVNVEEGSISVWNNGEREGWGRCWSAGGE